MAIEREIAIKMPEEELLAAGENRPAAVLNLPVSKANAIAEGYLRDIGLVNEEDDYEARLSLNELINQISQQSEQAGDADDFHNFAVTLARKDEYGLACSVLECGLKWFPKNVDLIADYLQYGVNCGKGEECRRLYKTLLKIPKMRWTWRGFAFLIYYIQYLLDQSDSEKEILHKKQEMLELVSDFKRYFPYSEEAYHVESSIYKNLNEQGKELETLKTAMETLIICPKCALRCADILFDRGCYEEAMEAIKRGISDATQTQSSINEGYIYYLSALCRIALSQKSDTALSKQEVMDIYSNFNIALRDFRYGSNYEAVIKSKTNTLVNKTNVDVPPELSRLYDCIAE